MYTHRGSPTRCLIGVALALFLVTMVPSELLGQQFGRNKVQWKTFDFQVMETDHFDIHFYPEALEGVTDAGRMAERWYERLSRAFTHEFTERKPVILYANHPDFMQTNVIDAMLGEGTGGVTEGLRTRVVMPLTGIYANTDHVLGHELVHAFQYNIAGEPGGAGLSGMGRLPLWFVEGMAEYLSIGREDAHTAMWLRDAMLRDELPTTRAMTRDPRYFPYRFGQAFWAYVAGTHGDEVVGRMYRAGLGGGVEGAIRAVLETTPDSLSARWHETVRAEYGPLVEGRTLPENAGRAVLTPDRDAGRMNLSPVLSPDGRTVAFLSERDLFRIELFLADAETGRVLRRVISDESDPHFDALSFMRSAGTWSPDGSQLAVVVFRRGVNQLAIVDVASGRLDRLVRLDGINALWDPAWSPDGRHLAFAGGVGGISNLYLHDVETGAVEQLTSGREAMLQPTWSPDGGTLAFVTDAGPGTDFQQLTYAPMRLALYDVGTRQVRHLEVFEDAKHINPQFSPDGSDLYFISDRGGFSDVYRLALGTGQVYQVTTMATGVSGITDLASAMSVARHTGRMLFSVFSEGNYNVYALEPGEARGVAVAEAPTPPALAAVLPPIAAHRQGLVAAYLDDPVTGLADAGNFDIRPYTPRISLDYIGVPALGVAMDQFGTTLGGAVAAYFGDMLGDRTLGAQIMTQGELADAGGQLFWMNRRARWNWMAGLSRIPYVTGRAGAASRPDLGPDAYEIQQLRDRVAFNRAVADARYPFDSMRRFETNLTFTNIGFSRQIESTTVVGGRVVERERESLDAPESLNFVSASAAYVGDNSFFGFTSPVRGWRYRYEISPHFGDLTFQQALADYRRYQFLRPATLAFRALHFGRYGEDSDNGRLQPLFLGHETFIRGYGLYSFSADECTVTGEDQACPEFDRLIGSRLAVANAEIRVPLLGTADLGLIEFPWLPTEVAAFFDAGVAWTGDESPSLAFERRSPERIPVFSAGLTSRFNVMGYLIVEAYWAYPFQRPERGAHFGFHIAPGW
jgi:Tol biopolymer transport system component